MASDGKFKDLKQCISSALIETTRTAGQISSEDLAFQRSANPSIVPLLERQSSRLLALVRGLTTKSAALGSSVAHPHIINAGSVEDHWKEIVDVIDNLLEKVDACLDEYSGVIRRSNLTQQEQMKKAATPSAKQKLGKAHRTQNIAKPQLLFDNVPNNDETSPFKPFLRTKPHAIVAFDESLKVVTAGNGNDQYNHPYETEIAVSQYPAATRVQADPIRFSPYESSEATWVDTPETLLLMLDELKLANEIAVDLEHHDEHSYVGLVSLMQISTRDKDWVIDTLKPWREKLQVLNEVFTDPKILKVLHGSSMDVIWLQRDFGLYLVGLFDTFHASKLLGYPKHGLAYLMKRFANFDAAKQYQMADWRIRPIPRDMFDYARSDTHFLLYIYDNMRNELIDKSNRSEDGSDFITIVMDRSKEEALQRYERHYYDLERGSGPIGWYNMLCRTPTPFNREQFAVFRALHQWRDRTAREEDESVHVIMAKHVLFNLAREMPVDTPSLLGYSHPISRSLNNRQSEILAIITKARILSHNGPNMTEIMHTMQPITADGVSKLHRAEQVRPAFANAKKAVPSQLRCYLSRVPVQSERSRFWGSVFPHNMDLRAVTVPRDNFRLTLPMPQLSAEIFEDMKATYTNAIERLQTNLGARDPYIEEKKFEADELFVVKEAMSPRKRKTPDSYGSPNAVCPRLEDNAADDALEQADGLDKGPNVEILEHQDSKTTVLNEVKDAICAGRPEIKRLKKDGFRGNQNAKSHKPGEVEPFDYAYAPSVLHPQGRNNRIIASKEMNFYSKSSNAPKAMQKSKPEQEGTSLTITG